MAVPPVAILPIVLAPVVVGLFWRTLMLSPSFGIFDLLTTQVLGRPTTGSATRRLALVSVILIHTWQWTPFAFLVLLASLASIPPDLYEAARIDRAGAIARFRYITLPLIRPAIVIVIIMRAMIALSAFAAIYAATGGGPGTATQILNLYAYQTSFVSWISATARRSRSRCSSSPWRSRRMLFRLRRPGGSA